MRKITFALITAFITSTGFSQSATVTFNDPLTFGPADFNKLFETGDLTGTLTGVEIYGMLTASANFTYANDLTIYVTATDVLETGGLLQVGGFSDFSASEKLDWPCGAACDTDDPGTIVQGFVSVNPLNFTANPTYTVWIGNGYGAAGTEGTWDDVEVTLTGVEEVLSVGDQTIDGFTQFYNSQSKNLTIVANENFTNIQLFNILGQEVISQKLSSNKEVINLSYLNNGVYIANVTSNGSTTSFKIVKR